MCAPGFVTADRCALMCACVCGRVCWQDIEREREECGRLRVNVGEKQDDKASMECYLGGRTYTVPSVFPLLV